MRKHERDDAAVLRVLEEGPARYMEILRAAGMTSYALREALNRLIRCKQVVADGVMVITYRKVK
jgi:DNA-binding HxlR family transcriptional regulator